MNPFTEIEPTNQRVVIEDVTPMVDGGRFAVKRVVGDEVGVEANVFADGHDHVAGVIQYRALGDDGWHTVPLEPLMMDRRRGSFTINEPGGYQYRIQGWIDHFDTWTDGLEKKVDAGQDVSVDLEIGAELVTTAAARAKGATAKKLSEIRRPAHRPDRGHRKPHRRSPRPRPRRPHVGHGGTEHMQPPPTPIPSG